MPRKQPILPRDVDKIYAPRRELAASMAAPPELLHHFPFLFSKLTSLGSSASRVVGLLESALATTELGKRSPRPRLIDLACGLGNVSIEAAHRLDARTLGVDAYAPFLTEAARRAHRRGVAPRCQWLAANVLSLQRDHPAAIDPPFDIGVMLNLFGAIKGRKVVRGLVRPGGLYVVDDACLVVCDDKPRRTTLGGRRKPRPTESDVRLGAPTPARVRSAISRDGDDILYELAPSPSAVRRQLSAMEARIASRAAMLSESEPGLRRLLKQFVVDLARSRELLETQLRPTIWVVRRA
ncbi:MAG: class I SAM-dependent methyltransferase [Planctomycetota bacterium]|nr:class I SAM-dependent methyltransferase [Planctomycetota bacterium]